MVVLYSGEQYRDLLASSLPASIKTLFLPNISSAPALGSEPGAFLTDLDDRQNLETLNSIKNVNLILPIRPESVQEDVNSMVGLFLKSAGASGSYLLSNHVETSETFSQTLVKSGQRWKLIDQIGLYVADKNCFEDFPELCMTAASELLTNAFYNGPRDRQGSYIETDRTKEIEISAPQVVRFSYGDDGQHIWMKITDPFGTFDRKGLLAHLIKCLKRDSLEVNFGPGGAGIGLFMVFRWASQLLFMFEPGKETTVLVKFVKTRRRKVFDSKRTVFEVVER